MDSVQPLRISKTNFASSPSKSNSVPMAKPSRPLSEIGITSQRRNSPSHLQTTKRDSSGQDTSLHSDIGTPIRAAKSSLREFWSSKEAARPSGPDENISEHDFSPNSSAVKRRPSVERLMQASRVKNSNMFALENRDAYDPTSTPIVERPSANRPLSEHITNNSFARLDSLKKEGSFGRPAVRNSHIDSSEDAWKSPSRIPLPSSPEKQSSPSPTKSSLARVSQFGIAHRDFGEQSKPVASLEERIQKPRTLRRHAKSVTFHEDPPEVNEYEQQTPEPSVSFTSDREGSWESDEYYDHDYSFERPNSLDPHDEDSFDADLENADKTPVVLPEHWSRMSPSEARTDLVDGDDDVFDPADEDIEPQPDPTRSETRSASDGEARPLPPLPSMRSPKSGSDSSLMRDRTALLQQASYSKADILDIARASPLSGHERLSMLASPKHTPQPSVDLTRDPKPVVIKDSEIGDKSEFEIAPLSELSLADDLPDFTVAPRISRESILRKVRNTKYDFDDEDEDEDENDSEDEFAINNQSSRPTISELARMDPDEPVPSREISREEQFAVSQKSLDHVNDMSAANIKLEPEDEEVDLLAIPAYSRDLATSGSPLEDDYDRDCSVLHHRMRSESEDEEYSVYSESILPDGESTPTRFCTEASEEATGKESLDDAMKLLTVRDYAENSSRPVTSEGSLVIDHKSDSPSAQFPKNVDTQALDSGFANFSRPKPATLDIFASMPTFLPGKPEDLGEKENLEEDDIGETSEIPQANSPIIPSRFDGDETSEISAMHESDLVQPQLQEIPERKATIKTNGRLKARPSGSAADFAISAEQRRLEEEKFPVPAIPQGFTAQIEDQEGDISYTSSESEKSKADSLDDGSFVKKDNTTMLSLDFSGIASEEEEGLGLDAEFDKVIESQKKGYVTRENAKVVVASNRNVSGDSQENAKSKDSGPSRTDSQASSLRHKTSSGTRKASGEQYLKTEPWNGTTRRKSIRNASTLQTNSAPAPPPPGYKPLDIVDEDYATAYNNLNALDGEDVERGRLFVKVVGARDLDLPLPKNERLHFQLTLDNGLHCVTTADLELDRSAPISQEFELVVLNDLEFQLTLTTKLPTPPTALPAITSVSPNKQTRTPKSGFSRFLSSPKKRAEKERQEREAAEAEQRRLAEEAQRRRAKLRPTAWDLLHDLVNEADGSFARAYVNLQAHEKECFGRQLTVKVPCYNEWALEKDVAVMTSVRSKRGNNAGPVRRPPYIIGHLELQLLYIPRPAAASDEDFPKSMNAAIREMKKAEETKSMNHEGYLSQQGGDCKHWRRRFFRLQGSRLTAYHEHTNQKRAVINLSKASRLVDDRSTLVADPISANPKSKSRRKSAFAEEDEGYQYVEEGFRLRFANGETIDFYADSRARKDEWMQALSQVIGKQDTSKKTTTWTDLVLAREQADANANKTVAVRTEANAPSTADVLDSISKSVTAASTTKPLRKHNDRKPLPAPTTDHVEDDYQHAHNAAPARARTPPLNPRSEHRTRSPVKSMIF